MPARSPASTQRSRTALAVLSAVTFAPTAVAAPLQTLTPTAPSASWTGERATGANVSFMTSGYTGGGQCGKDITTYCEDTLVKVSFAEPTSAFLRVRLDGYDPAVSDFDLRVYSSSAAGQPGTFLGTPDIDNVETSPLGSDDPRNYWAGDYESMVVRVSRGTRYYLVRAVYFGVVHGTYTGSATLSGARG